MADAEIVGRRTRKPSLKRRLAEASDDEDEVYNPPPPKKVTKTSKGMKRAKSSSEEAPAPPALSPPTADPPNETAEENMDVDVEGDAAAPLPSASSSQTSVPASSNNSVARPSAMQRSHSQQNSVSGSQPKRRARRAVVMSDDDDSGDEYAASKDATFELEGSEQGKRRSAVMSRSPSPQVQAKEKEKHTPSTSRSGNSFMSARIPKKKKTSDRDDKPILMKNESTATAAAPASPAVSSPAGSGLSSGTPTDASKPAPAKRKLPPIKKIKAGDAAGPGSSPLSAKPSASGSTISDLLGPASKIRARTANSDVDLLDGSVYASLFKNGANSARKQEEERRKQRNQMRDDARAQREASLATCFDLQAVMDKVSRFEHRYASRNALFFPTFLGGALGDRARGSQAQQDTPS